MVVSLRLGGTDVVCSCFYKYIAVYDCKQVKVGTCTNRSMCSELCYSMFTQYTNIYLHTVPYCSLLVPAAVYYSHGPQVPKYGHFLHAFPYNPKHTDSLLNNAIRNRFSQRKKLRIIRHLKAQLT